MIKNWEMFNESDIYFDNSSEFSRIVQKYALNKEDIKQFLDELKDECDFEITQFSNENLKEINEDSFSLTIVIKMNKYYEIEEGVEGYTKFLKEHAKDLEYYLKIMALIQETEGLKDRSILSIEIPQQQATQDKSIKNTSKRLELVAKFTQEIKTNEMKKALDDFTKTQSISGKILIKVIDKLVEMGFNKSRSELSEIVEIDPDWEKNNTICYGIWTDDDMYIIAEYDKKTKVLGFNDQLIDDLKEYLDEL